MKPIPSKTDILADLHRLKILIGKKYISDVDKLSMRYFHILNKMICAHPKNFQNFQSIHRNIELDPQKVLDIFCIDYSHRLLSL